MLPGGDLACAVNYCQENSAAHGHIKPDNILMAKEVSNCDFGLDIKVSSGQEEFKGGGGMVRGVVRPGILCITSGREELSSWI